MISGSDINMQGKPYKIGLIVYDKMDLLDITVPYELFNWMAQLETSPPRGVRRQVRLISVDGSSVTTRDGLRLGENLPSIDQAEPMDFVWVPGGEPARLAQLMGHPRFMEYLRRQS